MGKADSKKLPAVAESVLKRRKRRELNSVSRVHTSIKRRAANYKKKRTIIKSEDYIKKHSTKNRDEMRIKREARHRGNYYVASEAKLAFVILTRSASLAASNVQKILKLLGLRNPNRGVFLKLNELTVNMLRIVEPYITWGYPTLKSVRDLVFKRGFTSIKKKQVPLTSNTIIENALGESGMICIEDLIHEIFTVGPKFTEATNFLSTFKLNVPNGGWGKKPVHFTKGGECGNRGDKIDELLRRMI